MTKLLPTLLIFILIIGLGSETSAQGGEVKSFTLQQAIDFALENNEQVKNTILDIAYAEKDVRQYKAAGYPQVNASLSYQNFPSLPTSLIPAEFLGGNPGEFAELQFGTSNNMTLNINASQMLFDGTFFFGLQAAQRFAEFTEKNLDRQAWEIKNTISKAYFSALIVEQTGHILASNVAAIQKLYNETNELFNNGFIEEIEADRLRLSLTNVEAQYSSIKRQVRLAYGLLKFQMGMPITDSIQLTDKLEDIPLKSEALLKNISPSESRIDYQLLSMQEELLEYQVRVTRSGYFPKANLIASFDESAQRNSFDFFDFDKNWYTTFLWGVNISIPIYDGGQKSSLIQKQRLNIEKVRNTKSQLRNSILLEVEQTRATYLNALEALEAQEKNLELAEKIFNTVVMKYNEGVGSSLELSNAETTLFQTQTNYLNALYSILTAKADLEKALGL